MKEVILNDECIHCNDRECHDGEHFCNQAMKENSFYKNAKLYKGLEVIQRPTYEELEKENAELVQNKYNLEYKIENLENKIEHHQEVINTLQKENAELKADNDARKFAMAMSEKVERQLRNERDTFLAQNEQYEEDLIDFNEKLTKAKELLKWFVWYFREGSPNLVPYKHKVEEAEQFLNSEVDK